MTNNQAPIREAGYFAVASVYCRYCASNARGEIVQLMLKTSGTLFYVNAEVLQRLAAKDFEGLTFS